MSRPLGGGLPAVSVESVKALKAAVLAMKALPRDLKNEVNRNTRAELNPIWRDELHKSAANDGYSAQDVKVLVKGARVRAGNPASVMAATSKRPLSGGLSPAEHGRVIEFGAPNRSQKRTYERRSKNGGVHKVTRATKAGLPARVRRGRVVHPALASSAPRLLSLWAQTIARTIFNATERN